MILDPEEEAKPITARSRAAWAVIVEARLVELGRSRRTLAAALGVTSRRLARQLRGQTDVTLAEAIEVLDELGIDYVIANRCAVVPRSSDTQ